MLLPVVIATCISTQTLAFNVSVIRAIPNDKSEALTWQETIRSSNMDENKNYSRSCTQKDEYCIPICCQPVQYDNRTTCYANASLSSIKDINFSMIDECNSSILNMSAEELIEKQYEKFVLDQDPEYDIVFFLFKNGTISEENSINNYVEYWYDSENFYCLTTLVSEDGIYNVDAVCFPPEENHTSTEVTLIYLISTAVSLPFLIVTFVIYSILPKFQNMHGFTLRAYIGSLTMMFTALIVSHFDKTDLCTSVVFITYFSSIACFSWVNVMSFDIWWTFRKCRPVQGNHKQWERKKFIVYSIFAWGSAAILTGICATIDYIPDMPDGFIKPELGIKSCWVFGTFSARAIYYYAPTSVSVICNFYLFASTIAQINQQKKELAVQFEAIDSRRHNYNKERFNFSVKLCAMMVINSSMEIINCLCKRNSLQYFWAILDLANTAQALTIFIIFVWTNPVKVQLYKRLGFQEDSFKNWSQLTKSGFSNQKGSSIITASK